MSISSTFLLEKWNFSDGHRLELHQKGNQVIAKLYQGDIKRGTYSLEGVSAKQWQSEPTTEIALRKLNRFLKPYGVRLEPARVTVKNSQKLDSTGSSFSPISSSSSPSTSGSSSSGFEEAKLPVGTLSLVTSSSSRGFCSSSHSFPSPPPLSIAQETSSPVDTLFHQILTLDRPVSLSQSLLPSLGPSHLEETDARGYNLLLAAVASGSKAKLDLILPLYENHMALYATDHYGRNALHIAAALGHAPFIPLLIKKGISLSEKDKYGLTPLHWAIHERKLDTLKTLIERGALLVEPWITPEKIKCYPLELAVVAGDPAILILLLESDAFGELALTQPVHKYGTLLHLAIQTDKTVMLKHLLSIHFEKTKSFFNHMDDQGRTPLQLAAYLGNLEAIELLEKHGADLHYGTGVKEGTAVHYAASGEQPEAIKLLWRLGAELQRTNGKGQTPIVLLEGKTSPAARKCRALLQSLAVTGRRDLTKRPNYRKHPPFNLVIQGGGPKGLAYLGALEQMEKLEVLKKLKRVAGTSAGAITAAFLAVGCTATELRVHLDRNLGEFLDGRGELEQSLLKGAQTGSYREVLQEILKDYWSGSPGIPFAKRAKRFMKKLLHLDPTALALGEEIRKWIESIIQAKTKIEHCTFKELKALIDRDPETYKELHVFSTCIHREKSELMRFSHEDKRWEDLIISDAIRASLSIPGVFKPHILRFKTATRKRHPVEDYGQFIDGGLLRNFPLDAFDAEKYQEDRHFLRDKTNRRTLGLSLRDKTVHQVAELGNISSSLDLGKALFNTFYHAEQILMEETKKYKDRTIRIPIRDVGLLDFNLSAEQREKLIASGKEEVESFFGGSVLKETHSKPIKQVTEEITFSTEQGIPWRYAVFYDFQINNHQSLLLNPVDSFAKHLTTFYEKQITAVYKVRTKRAEAWEISFPIAGVYTNLAIISDKERKEKNDSSQLFQDRRISTHETLFKPKEPINIQDIFKPGKFKKPLQKRVVVFGVAGVGKTTFCQMAAAQGRELWPEFNVIFLVKFRNLNKNRYPLRSEGYTSYDLLSKECGFNLVDYKTFLEDPLFRDKALVILDGYDEIPKEVERDGHLENAFQSLKIEFPHILVTSRPTSIDLDNTVEMEIMGFDDTSMKSYIHKFYHLLGEKGDINKDEAERKASRLQKEIKNRPILASLVQIPINLALACSLFKEDETFMDAAESTSITGFYIESMNWFYKRYQLRPGVSKSSEASIRQQLNPQLLNKKVKHLAMALEEIAWLAMEQNTLYPDQTFVEEALGKTNLNLEDLINMGLFSVEDDKGQFIHLTFQEFFAAQYLAKLYMNGQRKQAKIILAEKKFEPRYQLALSMVGGILSRQKSQEQMLENFFEDLFDEPYDLAKGYELSLMAGCFAECVKPNKIWQYENFIDELIRYLRSNFALTFLSDLINKHNKMLDHPKIIDFLNSLKMSQLKELLKSFKSFKKLQGKGLIIKTLEQSTRKISVKCDVLVELVERSFLDMEIQTQVLDFFIELVKQKETRNQGIKGIIKLIKKSSIESAVRSRAFHIFEELVVQVGEASDQIIEELTLLIRRDPFKGNPADKELIVQVLNIFVKMIHEKERCTKGIEVLIKLIQDSFIVKPARNYIFDILVELVMEGGEKGKKVVDALAQFITDFNHNERTSVHICDLFEKLIVQSGEVGEKGPNILVELIKNTSIIEENRKQTSCSFAGSTMQETINTEGEVNEQEEQENQEEIRIKKLSSILQPIEKKMPLRIFDIFENLIIQRKEARAKGVGILIELFQDESLLYSTRQSCICTLIEIVNRWENIGDREIGILREFVKAKFLPSDIQRFASDIQHLSAYSARALGKLAAQNGEIGNKVLKVMLEFLSKSSEDLAAKICIIDALAEWGRDIGDPGIDALIELAKDKSLQSNVKTRAVYGLGELAAQIGETGNRALKVLLELLNNDLESLDIRTLIADTLGKVAEKGGNIGDEEVMALVNLFKFKNLRSNTHKIVSAHALAKVGMQKREIGIKALEALQGFLNADLEDLNSRQCVVDALGEVVQQGGVPGNWGVRVLVKLMKDPFIGSYAEKRFFIALKFLKIENDKGIGDAILDTLISFIERFSKEEKDLRRANEAAFALIMIAQKGGDIGIKGNRILLRLLLTTSTNGQRVIIDAFGELAKQKGETGEHAVLNLSSFMMLAWYIRHKARTYVPDVLLRVATAGVNIQDLGIARLKNFIKSHLADKRSRAISIFALAKTSKQGMNEKNMVIRALREIVDAGCLGNDGLQCVIAALREATEQGKSLGKQELEILIEIFRNPVIDIETRKHITFFLASIAKKGGSVGAKALKMLVKFTNDLPFKEIEDARRSAATVLIQSLTALFQFSDLSTLNGAHRKGPVLVYSGGDRDTPKSEKIKRANAALKAIEKVEAKEVIGILIKFFNEEFNNPLAYGSQSKKSERADFAEMLGVIGQHGGEFGDEGIKTMLDLVNDESLSSYIRGEIAWGLGENVKQWGNIGNKGVETLVKLIIDKSAGWYARCCGIWILKEMMMMRKFKTNQEITNLADIIVEIIKEIDGLTEKDDRNGSGNAQSHAVKILVEIIKLGGDLGNKTFKVLIKLLEEKPAANCILSVLKHLIRDKVKTGNRALNALERSNAIIKMKEFTISEIIEQLEDIPNYEGTIQACVVNRYAFSYYKESINIADRRRREMIHLSNLGCIPERIETEKKWRSLSH